MAILILVLAFILSGCYGQGPAYYSYEARQIIDQRQCTQIADAYHFTGDTRQQYMGLCLGSGGGSAPIVSYPYSQTQYSTIGQPDPFGPMGYRGPTWEQYNHFYSQPPR